MTSTAVSWLRRYRSSPSAKFRLVCFPHAGGAASFYVPWAEQLAPEVEVLAVQYPGRQDRRREPQIANLMDVVPPIVEELTTRPPMPLAFFGHSMGSTVAFEVARLLRAQGHPAPQPSWFFASGRVAPDRSRPAGFQRMDGAALVAELRRLGATDERLLNDEELRSMIMPVIRGDFIAIDEYRYEPGPGLACPVTVLTGAADRGVPIEDAEAWASHTERDCEVRVLPGGHFFLVEHQKDVVDLILSRLRGVGGSADALSRVPSSAAEHAGQQD